MDEREKPLDGLRGIAVLMVIVAHTLHFNGSSLLSRILRRVAESGWMGVDLFFVLSGFLITRILVQTREDHHRARNFFARRALRILPAYWCYLAGVVLVLWLFAPQARLFEALSWVPHFLVFTGNFWSLATDTSPPLEFLHLWSLLVEEQFYLVWPFLVWSLPHKSLPRICLWVIGLSLAIGLGLALLGSPSHVIYTMPFTRINGFAVGAWLAWHHHPARSVLPQWTRFMPWLAALSLLILALSVQKLTPRSMTPLQTTLSTTCTALIFGGILHRALIAPVDSLLHRLLTNRVLLFFGLYSYSLYLVHVGMIVTFDEWLKPMLLPSLPDTAFRLARFGVVVLASLLIVIPLRYLVEKPALSLKRHFVSRASRGAELKASAHSSPGIGAGTRPTVPRTSDTSRAGRP